MKIHRDEFDEKLFTKMVGISLIIAVLVASMSITAFTATENDTPII